MITFRMTMDRHSQDVYRRLRPDDEPERIGSILWHPREPPRMYWCLHHTDHQTEAISLVDVKTIVEQLEREHAKAREYRAKRQAQETTYE